MFIAPAALGDVTVLSPAQVAEEYEHRVWTKADGLPDNQVQAILQTRDGYLWISTRSGLARFNGQKFTVFNRLNTLEMSDDDCRSLFEDGAGNFWVSGRAERYEYLGHHSPGFVRRSDLHGSAVPALCASRFGGLWGAYASVILRVAEGAVSEFHKSPPVWGGDGPTVMAEDHYGILWIGLNAGVLRFEPQTKRLERHSPGSEFWRLPVAALSPNASGECWMLFSEKPETGRSGGKLWLACMKESRWLRIPNLGEPDFHCDPRSFFLVEDHNKALWLPAKANSLHRFKNGEFQFVPIPHSGREDFVLCVYPDREGNLWIGTESSGLQRWQPRKIFTYTTRDSLPHDNTWTVCEGGDGSVWIGTDGGFSQFKNGRFTNFTEQEGLTKNTVRSLAVDRTGTVWIGTGDRLNALRDGKLFQPAFPYLPERTKIRVVLAGRDDTLWMGNLEGLHRHQNGQWTSFTVTNGLANQDVRALLEDHAGNLWLGTAGGGAQRFGVPPSGGSSNHNGNDSVGAPDRLKPGLQTFTTFSTTNGLSSDSAWALHEDSDGVIWIGTENGLNRLQNGRIRAYTTRQGLPVNLVNYILEDDFGRLWVSHDHGIYWMRLQDLNDVAAGRAKTVRCVAYDESDGMLSLETNGQKSNPAGCKTRDGRLWFSTTKGVAVIDPSKVALDDVPPLAAIEIVRANGAVVFNAGPEGVDRLDARTRLESAKALATSSQLSTRSPQLPPGSARVLEFHFTANTFVAPEKAKFKYRMLGLNDNWIEAGTRREAYFADLRSGDYQFEVIAGNHHGIWQEHGATFPFRIAPFIYQTWWFYVVCGGAAVGLVASVVFWRMRELRKIHLLEQQAAITAERTRIAKDLHDGLGADLTRLTMLADLASGETGSSGSELLKKLSSSSREAARELKELIWVANPANDTMDGLVSRICQTAEDFLGDARMKCRLDIAPHLPEQPLSIEQRRNFLLVARETFNNIVKHSGATEVGIRASGDGDSLQLSIEDNGRGFDPATARREGLGLSSMRRRIENLGGTFTLASHPGEGTKIIIALKLEQAP
jgi:signal transduction histidine kinase/ligand-binding sensor domain-containing protein